jgi:three-Cys-motif partner protein
VSSHRNFFQERRAQAVLKHGILARYPTIFASKLGYRDKRVVFLDGYAGRGEYKDGSPGSPILLAQTAHRLDAFRHVTAIYIEEDQQDFANLKAVMEPRTGRDFLLQGDVSRHLPRVMEIACDAPLFAFFDPFGTALDRDDLVASVMSRRSPPVEVLLHISVSSVARLGGLFRTRLAEQIELDSREQKSIEHLDRFLGGDWWKGYFAPIVSAEDEIRATEAALSVAKRYEEGICAETGFMSVSMPVRRRPNHVPTYILVLFTRHADGLWFFADALGKAGREWERAWREEDANSTVARLQAKDRKDGTEPLFDLTQVTGQSFDPVAYECANRRAWVEEIVNNVKELLRDEPGPVPAYRVTRIYGNLLGAAGERHVYAAMKILAADGIIEPVTPKDNYHRRPLRSLSL